MQLFGTVPLTWFSMFILTSGTSLHQKLAAMLVATSSLAVSHKMEIQLNWMEPFISHAPSSSLLLLLQQKHWTGCTFPKCTRSQSIATHPYRTQPSTTTNSNTHWQHNNSCNCQQHDQTTKITSNGDNILLVVRRQNSIILQVLLPSRPQEPWQLSIQTSYCRHTSTHQVILCPHEQLPHSLTKSYEAKHLSGVCWNPWGSLLQEIPIFKHWQFPLSGRVP